MQLTVATEQDAPALAQLFHSIGMCPTVDLPLAQSWIRTMNSRTIIGRILMVDGSLVGGGQLTVQKYPHAVEMGFWVAKDAQGRGYGKAVARLLAELALGPLGYHRVFGKTFANNVRSQRCLEGAGMVREGVLRRVGLKEGAYYDEMYYGRLATDAAPGTAST